MIESTKNRQKVQNLQTIKELIKIGADQLQSVADRAFFESKLLLSFATGLDQVELVTKSDQMVDSTLFLELIGRRADHEPIEYITGKASFYSRDFLTDPSVLIPRAETELLIDQALELISGVENPKIAEIGVGSGVISVMMAILRSDARITATDINPKALELAKKNTDRFGVADRIIFKNCSLLDDHSDQVDLIVSNPPYIAQDYPLEKNVLKEPKEALFGGVVGDEILKQIIDLASERKCKLACECGYDQRNSLEEYLEKKSAKSVSFYNDYAGFTRGFVARFDARFDD